MRTLVVLCALLSGVAFARSNGIETLSCQGCHGGSNNTTTITPEPLTFSPGQTITLHVRMSGAGSVGGLYFTSNGVGTLSTISGQNTRLSTGTIVHSSPKSGSGNAVTFDVKWTAPSTMGSVIFEAATVLANGNGSNGGDNSGYKLLNVAFGCAGTTYYRDGDGDGIGATSSGTIVGCGVPAGYSATDGDCDDYDNRKTPGKAEACNGIDDNCNGQTDEGLGSMTTWPDTDGDGYGWKLGAPSSGCGGGNRASNDDDCDDSNAAIHPLATEVCNTKDDNCDGQVDEGAKVRCGIGWCARYGPTCSANDCVAGAPLLERCNGLDDDCDGTVDDGDLCEAGGSCRDGGCAYDGTEVDAGPVVGTDAGPAVDAGTNPPPVTADCSSSGATALILLAALLIRRAPSPRGERVGERA